MAADGASPALQQSGERPVVTGNSVDNPERVFGSGLRRAPNGYRDTVSVVCAVEAGASPALQLSGKKPDKLRRLAGPTSVAGTSLVTLGRENDMCHADRSEIRWREKPSSAIDCRGKRGRDPQ